jgi:hypothetical protein
MLILDSESVRGIYHGLFTGSSWRRSQWSYAPGVTLTVALAECDSLITEICALPIVTAVTTPLADTVATLVFDDCQTNALPVSVAPDAESAVAVNAPVPPGWRFNVVGETVTEATAVSPVCVDVDESLPHAHSTAAAIANDARRGAPQKPSERMGEVIEVVEGTRRLR